MSGHSKIKKTILKIKKLKIKKEEEERTTRGTRMSGHLNYF